MIKCSFCGRWFRNKQAFRAHLRYCEPYRTSKKDSGPSRNIPALDQQAPTLKIPPITTNRHYTKNLTWTHQHGDDL